MERWSRVGVSIEKRMQVWSKSGKVLLLYVHSMKWEKSSFVLIDVRQLEHMSVVDARDKWERMYGSLDSWVSRNDSALSQISGDNAWDNCSGIVRDVTETIVSRNWTGARQQVSRLSSLCVWFSQTTAGRMLKKARAVTTLGTYSIMTLCGAENPSFNAAMFKFYNFLTYLRQRQREGNYRERGGTNRLIRSWLGGRVPFIP